MLLLSLFVALPAHADGTSCVDPQCLVQEGLDASAMVARLPTANARELVAFADATGLDEVVADVIVDGERGPISARGLALILLTKGRACAAAGDWQGAVQSLRAVPFEGARWYEARLLLAQAQHRLGLFAEAAHTARDVLVPPDGHAAPTSLPWDPDPALRARAMARIASVYQDVGDRPTAESFWRSTPLHERVASERWVGLASTVASDGEALGLRVTLADPALASRTWDPGGGLAWATALAGRCRVREAGLQRSMSLRRLHATLRALDVLIASPEVSHAALESVDAGLAGWVADRDDVRRYERQSQRLLLEAVSAPAAMRTTMLRWADEASVRRQEAVRVALHDARKRAAASAQHGADLVVAQAAHRTDAPPLWARGLPSRFHGEYWPDEHGRHLMRLRDDCVHKGRDVIVVYP